MLLVSFFSIPVFASAVNIGTKYLRDVPHNIFDETTPNNYKVRPKIILSTCDESIKNEMKEIFSLIQAGSNRVYISFSFNEADRTTSLYFRCFTNAPDGSFRDANSILYDWSEPHKWYHFRSTMGGDFEFVRMSDSSESWGGSSPYSYLDVTSEYFLIGSKSFADGILTRMKASSYSGVYDFFAYCNFESLTIVTDDDDVQIGGGGGGGGGGSGGGGDDGAIGGILDWIANFFVELGKLIVRIFVPDDDYFSNWFEEIKEAAMEKIGPIADIFGALGDAFRDLEGDNSSTPLILDIPANHFFSGFPGIRVDLLEWGKDLLVVVKGFLTACMVVFTAIACYRRLIVLFEGDV